MTHASEITATAVNMMAAAPVAEGLADEVRFLLDGLDATSHAGRSWEP